ncbi:lysine--tRNA ligase [bacterium]|nr:lysine--tRNA ligase [bacterium]
MSELDIQRDQRLAKIDSLREKGINPYPNDFRPSIGIPEVLDRYKDFADEKGSSERLSVAGRLVAKRGHGKTCFAHLLGDGARLQIYSSRDRLGDEEYALFNGLDIGDIIGVEGPIFRTRTGELTIMVERFFLLAKSLRPLPEKWHGLKDIETRYRQRYLDLFTNPESRQVFLLRSRIIKQIREFFNLMGFIEVETPMMQAIPGGAAARPFKTYHNALDQEFYLRIAPELYLKRLIVGGLDRVYELNRNFRNEGLSVDHNPEFTMLEFYMAYADYKELMRLTERLFCELAEKIKGVFTWEYQGNRIDFTPPWKCLTIHQAILENSGVKEKDLDDMDMLRKRLSEEGVPLTGKEGHGKLLLKIFESLIEPKLIQPTFIIDFPKEVSPLARSKDTQPDIVERFELYVAGKEIANAFSELNDPVDQRKRFIEQVEDSEEMEGVVKRVDEDYIQALEYGLPPTAGEGIGIDRLVMIFADCPSIREVILFPQLREISNP